MPTLPAANDTAKVEMRYLWSGEGCENVFHVHPQTDGDALNVNAIATIFANWWTNNLRPVCSVDIQLIEIKVTDLSTVTSPQVTYVTGLPSAGTKNVDSVSNNVAVIVKWLTGVRVRGGSGRSFICGCGEDNTNGQTLVNDAIVAYQAAMDALLTALNGAATPLDLVVLSYYFQGALRTVPQLYTVVDAQVSQQLGSMRTRLTGRRRRRTPANP